MTSTTVVPPCGLTLAHVEPVDVDRLVVEPVRDFFAMDDDEFFIRAVQRVESIDVGQEIVVGQDEKIVAVLTIPPHDFVGRGVAVAVDRVRVSVAFYQFSRFGGGGFICCACCPTLSAKIV